MEPHLDLAEVLERGESPRHLLMDRLCRPARVDRAMTETAARELIDAVIDHHNSKTTIKEG